MKPAFRHALIALALLAALPLRAQNARLPYAQLYQMQRVQNELSGTYTNLVVVLRMAPAATNAQAGDVDAYIDAKAGRILVPVSKDGNFSVPMRDDLLNENPWLVTNQPRGSMKLDWFVGLVVRRLGASIRYKSLMQVVKDCGDVRERMRQVFPSAPKGTVAGLKLTFAPAEKSVEVVIHTERADRKLVPDAKGELSLIFDPDLFAEDPLVTLSREPAAIELVSQSAAQ